MTRYVAYYRVSTDKQGKSGLGLDAQRQAVAGFVAGRGEIVVAHTEIESTRNKRPQMQAALDACRQTAQFHVTMKPLIQNLRLQGYSLAAIAKELNGRNIPTARGRRWYPTTVCNILKRPS
jgi:hypothetical protein